MKKKFVLLSVLILLFVFICPSSYAIGIGESYVESTDVKTSEIPCESGDIIKKDSISVTKYEYPSVFSNNTFKYITVKHVVTYTDKSTEEDIAVVEFLYMFRYNPRLRLAECMSTNCENNYINSDTQLESEARISNSTLSKGACDSSLKVSYKELSDESHYYFTCDSEGKIIT